MLTAAPIRAPVRSRAFSALALAAALLGALLPAGAARAEEAAPAGLAVQFPPVLTADTTTRLRDALLGPTRRYQAEKHLDGDKLDGFELLCDFNPDGQPNATEDFGACYDLAQELAGLGVQGVRTRAFVHGEVSRHAVLPVLACREIVMSSDPSAKIGKIAGPEKTLSNAQEEAYHYDKDKPKNVVWSHCPDVLIRKMYDKDLVVVEVSAADGGDRYRSEQDAVQAKLNSKPVVDLGAGAVASYGFAQAKEFGLSKGEAQNSLAEALDDFKLPRSSVSPLLDRTAACRIVVRGEVNGQLREDMERRINRALGDKANVILLQLECADGDDQSAYELANFLAALRDRADKPIKTVAYVTPQARNTAVFLALACDQIVMLNGARLGDFDGYLPARSARLEEIRKNLKETALKRFFPPLLAEGMVDPDMQIVQATSTRGNNPRSFLTQQQLNDDPRGWDHLQVVKRSGEYLTLTADDAQKYGVAQQVADYSGMCQLEGVQPGQVAEIDGGFLNALTDFLCNPWTSVVLVMIGVTCLIIELKMPGASLPGVIAAVCFVLFFWSQSQAHPQITWLAVLLFILGLVLIGVEVFVLPGTGVCGLSGVLLTLGGLALVAYGHWPQTGEDWVGFGQKLGPFGVGILAAVLLAFVVVRYLKHIPFLNRLMLKPQTEINEEGDGAPEPIRPELASLLGAIGVAATPLRPAGKTQFGEQFVDVVAEGGYVRPGTRVQVIEIEGNRVVVKEV